MPPRHIGVAPSFNIRKNLDKQKKQIAVYVRLFTKPENAAYRARAAWDGSPPLATPRYATEHSSFCFDTTAVCPESQWFIRCFLR